jgi:hypothetical protein
VKTEEKNTVWKEAREPRKEKKKERKHTVRDCEANKQERSYFREKE